MARPAFGARRIARVLREAGEARATRWRATRPMGLMGMRPLCPLPPPSKPAKASRRFPHLLGGKAVRSPSQAWSTGIAYVQMGGRRMCLAAAIGWCSRRAVSWRPSDAMRACEAAACAKDASRARGTPPIMDGGQGSVLGSGEYVSLLEGRHVTQGMDGRARWRGSVLMGRRFRTLGSECLRNEEHGTPARPEAMIRRSVDGYSPARPRQSPGCDTPSSWCFTGIAEAA